MEKSTLRKIYLEKRKKLHENDIRSLSKKIFENFISEFTVSKNQKVHCFLSISKKNEVDTNFFLEYFFKNNIRVFVPKVVDEELISIEITEESALLENSWGIKEPVENIDSGIKDFDLILVPLLYADSFGNRVGYGKGFYDRFFSEINPNSLKIGLNFFSPEELIDDVAPFDIALDYLVTPTAVLSFTGFTSKSKK